MKTIFDDEDIKRIAEITSDLVVVKMKSQPTQLPEEEKYLSSE